MIDLHSHSTWSDGTLSPAELVERAHQQGVQVLALTDHDEIGGLAEARRAASSLGITLINGVEISTSWGKITLHIVGLNVDPEHPTLQAGLARLRDIRIERTEKIAEKLAKNGIPYALEAVIQMAGTPAVTRTHFARYLVESGHAKDMGHAFRRWLGNKGRAYVSVEWASVADVVGWITASGGQAVIAHPARYRLTMTRLNAMLDDFVAAGGVGLEVACGSHDIAMRRQMTRVCESRGLLASAGSDFHSPEQTRIELGRGLWLPETVKPVWHDWSIDPALRDGTHN